eukprot:7859557-Alexandrium_andersonii.AAC.1
MSASLVGSEMCIRDRAFVRRVHGSGAARLARPPSTGAASLPGSRALCPVGGSSLAAALHSVDLADR